LAHPLISHITRTNNIPVIQSQTSWPLIITTLVICAAGIALPFSSFARGLGFVALPWTFWPVVASIICLYLVLALIVKNWFIRRFGWN